MITIESYGTIFFKILNSVVFIGVCIYFFRRYLLADVKDQIAAEQNLLNDLKNHKDLLRTQQRDIEQKLIDQQESLVQLQRKITYWQAADAATKLERHTERERLRAALVDRVAAQTDWVEKERAYHQVMPQVLENSSTYLMTHYTDEQRRNSMQGMIAHMNHMNGEQS